jgi:hypothetical protein
MSLSKPYLEHLQGFREIGKIVESIEQKTARHVRSGYGSMTGGRDWSMRSLFQIQTEPLALPVLEQDGFHARPGSVGIEVWGFQPKPGLDARMSLGKVHIARRLFVTSSGEFILVKIITDGELKTKFLVIEDTKLKMTTEPEQKSVFPLFPGRLVASDQKAHFGVFVC